jgi:hypothetical protein
LRLAADVLAHCVLKSSPMRSRLLLSISILFCLLLSRSSWAVSLQELRNTPNLTPQKFASFFSNFEFKFHDEVQSPDVFLATESGDCDDYAILAASILKERGYTPRLITVRMPKVIHVVCYIEETKSYLDYNNRSFMVRTVNSGPEIGEIAKKVSKSYHTHWSSASEFTYEAGAKRLVQTVMEGHKEESRFAGLFR